MVSFDLVAMDFAGIGPLVPVRGALPKASSAQKIAVVATAAPNVRLNFSQELISFIGS